MARKPISVTLDETNLLWLRAQVAAKGGRSLSQVLDRLVTDARVSPTGRHASRSVVGSIDIDEGDAALHHADDYVRTRFDASLVRPLLVKEARKNRRG